jgi:hypothetical protein
MAARSLRSYGRHSRKSSYSFVTIRKLLTRCGARMPLTGVEYRRVASRGALLAFVRAHRERLAAQSAVPEDVKFRKTQEIAGKEAE